MHTHMHTHNMHTHNMHTHTHMHTHVHTHKHTVHEWCDKWHIHVQPNNVTMQSILEDLGSLCSNSRKFAIAATALLTENHTRNTAAADRLRRHATNSEVATAWQTVSPHLEAKLCQLLDDPVEHVRVPAAVTLYCLEKENDKVPYNWLLDQLIDRLIN